MNTQTDVEVTQEFTPSDERRALYDKYWAEAQTRQRSSSENFDKSILTYSSAGLAVSLTFLKDFVPVRDAVFVPVLYASWLCFVAATALTIISFLISYKAQELSISFAEEYFINGKEEFCNRQTWHSSAVKWFNILSGVLFVAALIATSLFVKLNMDEKAKTMEKKIVMDGMPPALMQKVSGVTQQRGLPPASMPKAPTPAQPANGASTPATPASPPATGGTKN